MPSRRRKVALDIATILEEIGKLRTELAGKMDKLSEQMDSRHGQLEARVRALESFKAWAVGAMAAAGVVGTVVGSAIGWLIKASH